MNEIGVWDCPRVIRSERRLEVMKANSYSNLGSWMGFDVRHLARTVCWSRYLSDISKRGAQTKSGQEFYLKEVAWIDGLEIEAHSPCRCGSDASQAGAIQASPEHHPFALGRRGQQHRTELMGSCDAIRELAVSSRHRMVCENPLKLGFCPLNPEARRPTDLRSWHASGLNSLPPRELLNILGVVTLDEASIPRLVNGLHELAERKEQAEPEALRHFSALVHDLYEAIQVKLKAEAMPTDALKPLLDHPVPLLTG